MVARPEQLRPRSWELVGSSLVAWRGKGAAWGRLRKIWGCSPRAESDQDGPGQEIDGGALFLGKKQRSGELELRSLVSSVVAWSCTRAYL